MHCWEIPENRGQEDNKFKDRKKKREMGFRHQTFQQQLWPFEENRDGASRFWGKMISHPDLLTDSKDRMRHLSTDWGTSNYDSQGSGGSKGSGRERDPGTRRGPTRQAAGWRLHRHCWCLSVSAPYVQFLSSDEKYLAYQQQTGQCYRQKKYQLWGGGSG